MCFFLYFLFFLFSLILLKVFFLSLLIILTAVWYTFTITITYSGIAFCCLFNDAFTLLVTVGTKCKVWTHAVTVRTKVPWQALAKTEPPVTISSRAYLRTDFITEFPITSRRTTILTVNSLDSWWAPAFTGHVVARSTILTCANTVTFLSIEPLKISIYSVFCRKFANKCSRNGMFADVVFA